MDATFKKVIDFIQQHELFSDSDQLLVAVSGGPDSMFLIEFLRYYMTTKPIVAHVNYQIRAVDSDQDQQFIKDYCEDHQLECYCSLTPKLSEEGNFQSNARKFRYEYFNKLKALKNVDYITTAHHIDDSLETIFLNLLRGTGIKGLSGIPVRNQEVVRPLLCLTKNEILEWLDLNNIPYRVDSSNSQIHYNRNYIRNKIFPLISERFPDWKAGLATTIGNLKNDYQYIINSVASLAQPFIDHENGHLAIPVSALPPSRKTFLFHLSNRNCNMEEIDQLLTPEHTSGLIEKSQFTIQKDRDKIWLVPNLPFIEPSIINSAGSYPFSLGNFYIEELNQVPDQFPTDSNQEIISSARLNFPLHLRKWNEGDRIAPLGMQKKEKLVSDLLIDDKVPAALKKEVWVLEEISTSRIIWVLGIKLSDHYKTQPKEAAFKLSFDLNKRLHHFKSLLKNIGL